MTKTAVLIPENQWLPGNCLLLCSWKGNTDCSCPPEFNPRSWLPQPYVPPPPRPYIAPRDDGEIARQRRRIVLRFGTREGRRKYAKLVEQLSLHPQRNCDPKKAKGDGGSLSGGRKELIESEVENSDELGTEDSSGLAASSSDADAIEEKTSSMTGSLEKESPGREDRLLGPIKQKKGCQSRSKDSWSRKGAVDLDSILNKLQCPHLNHVSSR